eukprot:801584-Pyramimonas_sp.AAC.1
MGRPSRSSNFENAPRVWSHGGGEGREVGPSCNPGHMHMTKAGYKTLDEVQTEFIEKDWEDLDEEHRLKRCSRGRHQARSDAPAS